MKVLNQYKIDIYKLSDKEHTFDFIFKDEFFEAFEESIIEKGEGTCHLILDKSDTMIKANFEINALVELICDRSLEPFNFQIEVNESLLIKFGDEDIELSDEIISIRRETQSINVAQNIFEYLTISVPMKKLHPRIEDEGDEETDSFIYSSEEDIEENDNDEQVDPRWEALKKLNKQ